MGWFGRKKDPETPEEMLARFHAEAPSSPQPPAPGVPRRAAEGMLTVEDVFQITGRGLVATGTVQFAPLSAGDSVTIRRADGTTDTATVKAIERRGRRSATAEPGTMIGVLFVERARIAAGDALTF